MINNKIKVLFALSLVLLWANCKSVQDRVPRTGEERDISQKKILIIASDTAAPLTDPALAPGAAAAKGAFLKAFNTTLILPALPTEAETLPMDFTLAGVNGVDTINGLDGAKVLIFKKTLDLAGKIGAFDTVAFVYTSASEKPPLGFIGALLGLPPVKTVVFYGSLYDVKSERLTVAAMKEYQMPSSAFIAQYPLTANSFATYLLKGK